MVQQATVTLGQQEAARHRNWPADVGFLTPLWRFCRTQPLGAFGGVIFILLVFTAIFAPLLAPYNPKLPSFTPYTPPNAEVLMGTDHLGRDVFSRVIWGARLSLSVGLTAVGIGVTIGTLWGLVAAYFGGVLDLLSQRVVDSLLAFPAIILAICLMAVLGQAVSNVMIALSILLIPTSARVIRSTTLSIKESVYVEAARAIGGSHVQIIRRHIIPNSMAPFIILFSVNLGFTIVVEASLSFLGLGAPPDEPSWGGMLNLAADSLLSAPWMSLFPGAAISLAVFGLNMLGDAIRDVLDPKLRGQDVQSKN